MNTVFRSSLGRLGLLLATALLATCGTDGGTDPVLSGPVADFTARPNESNSLEITFTDASQQGDARITTRLWSFGDGETSSEPSPTHLYEEAAAYRVTLSVTTSVGSHSKTDTIDVVAPQVPPTADFTATPDAGDPLLVQFEDASLSGSEPITSHAWSFGDGSESTEADPSHRYEEIGTYEVSLTVTTAAGSDTKAAQIDIMLAPVPPVADFTFREDPNNPLGLLFTDASTPGSQEITAWNWNFGDGSTSSVQNPAHTYATPGTKTVTLTVTTSVGSNSTSKSVAVVPPRAPTANFSVDRPGGVSPVTIRFRDLSEPGSDPITSWRWEFGNGRVSTDRNPSVTFTTDEQHRNEPQFFDVKLTVTSAAGSDTRSVSRAVEAYQLTYDSGPTDLQLALPTYGTPTPATTNLVQRAIRPLRTFTPLVTEVGMVVWSARREANDCVNTSYLSTTPPSGTGSVWYSSIPTQSGGSSHSRRWVQFHEDEGWPNAFPTHMTIVANGAATPARVRWQSCKEFTPFLQDFYTRYTWSYNQPVESLPYVKRTKYWKRVAVQPLGTTNLYSRSETVSVGINETTSRALAISVSTTASVGAGGVAASLTASFGATFTESVEITSSRSVTDTYTSPAHKPNYNLLFTLWQEVERYEIVNSSGSRWNSVHYRLSNPGTQLFVENPTGRVVAYSKWFRVQ